MAKSIKLSQDEKEISLQSEMILIRELDSSASIQAICKTPATNKSNLKLAPTQDRYNNTKKQQRVASERDNTSQQC